MTDKMTDKIVMVTVTRHDVGEWSYRAVSEYPWAQAWGDTQEAAVSALLEQLPRGSVARLTDKAYSY